MKRLFLLGVDGITFDLLKPWVQQGHLPGFAKIMAQGCHANLKSSLPPLSPVAWTSIATGVNPGKHGVYDFVLKKEGAPHPVFSFVTGKDRRTKAFWEILSDRGKKCVVVNMPCSYPPDPVNGIMISGWDGSKDLSKCFHPPELYRKTIEKYGAYYLVPLDLISGNEMTLNDEASNRRLFEALLKMVKLRRTILLDFAVTELWDVFFGVFTETDVAQHRFWHTVNEPDLERNLVFRIYREVDEFIQDVMKRLGDQIDIMVVSDHGFGPMISGVDLNLFLEQKGLLKRNFSVLRSTLSALFRHLRPLRRIVRAIQPKRNRPERLSGDLKHRHFSIDVAQSKVFFEGAYPFFHLVGNTSPEEVYPVLKEQLMSLSLNGRKVFKDVLTREQAFSGPYLHDIPQFIGVMNQEFEVSGADVSMATRWHKKDIFCEHVWNGNHSENGVFIYYGSGVAGRSPGALSVMDIAPTVLAYYGLPVPREMDGRVIDVVVSPDHVLRDEYNIYKDSSVWSSPQSAEDSAVLRERLEALGYL